MVKEEILKIINESNNLKDKIDANEKQIENLVFEACQRLVGRTFKICEKESPDKIHECIKIKKINNYVRRDFDIDCNNTYLMHVVADIAERYEDCLKVKKDSYRLINVNDICEFIPDNGYVCEEVETFDYDDEISITNEFDFACKVFHGEVCLGKITNTMGINDFLKKIKDKKDKETYYVKCVAHKKDAPEWQNKKFYVNADCKLEGFPEF